MLLGRNAELKRIDRLVADAREGRGGGLIFEGEPGMGKTALLRHAAGQATAGLRVLAVRGAEGEARMPYAALHMMLRPFADRLDELPGPQAEAMRGVFGMGPVAGQDRFLVGLGTLGLLTGLAAEQPLLCVVDDVQCIDTLSIGTLGFVARRVGCDPIGLVAAVGQQHKGAFRLRNPANVPVVLLEGLENDAAIVLLGREFPNLPKFLRDRVISEAEGNPLALLELPKAIGDGVMFGSAPARLTGRLRDAFSGQTDSIVGPAQVLLVVIAAEGAGDLGTVVRAAEALGVPSAALTEVEQAGLIVVEAGSVRFRHPLVGAATYHGASFMQRQAVHRALASALRDGDPEGSVRHLAMATLAPDEGVAAALERTARSAARRDGPAAAAAVYERAAQLSEENTGRARRLAAGAESRTEAGHFRRAEELRATAERLTEEPSVRARLIHLRGRLEFASGRPREAARLAIEGGRTYAVDDPVEAATLLVTASYFAARSGDLPLAGEAVALLDTLDLPQEHALLPQITQARTYHRMVTGGTVDVSLLVPVGSSSDRCRATAAGMLNLVGHAWSALEVASALAADMRARGEGARLANAMFHESYAKAHLGRHLAAVEEAETALTLAEDTGHGPLAAHIRGLLARVAALEGDADRCRTLAGESIRYAQEHGMPPVAADAGWALGLLELGQGRYESALSRMANRWPGWPYSALWTRSTADHIEAAVRAGDPATATRLLSELEQASQRLPDPCAPAVVARCRALAGDAEHADRNFLAALEPGPCDDQPFEQARTLLDYGRWLRRAHRKADARVRLRAALEIFQRMGAAPWAACAQGELRATGACSGAAARTQGLAARLTPQERQVVRLALTGATNRDIGAQLFLSPRTVAQHLHHAFPKLGVATRTELARLDLDL